MKKLLTIITLLSAIQTNAAQMNEQDLQPYLEKTTAWLTAFYSHDAETRKDMQSASMNAMNNPIRKQSPMTNPKFEFNFNYRCQHYYIAHALKQNLFNGINSSLNGVSSISPNTPETLSVFSFSECGIDYVKHISGFKLNFDTKSGLITSVKNELNLHQDEGFTQQEIDAYMLDYSNRVELFDNDDITDVNIESQKAELEKRMGIAN